MSGQPLVAAESYKILQAYISVCLYFSLQCPPLSHIDNLPNVDQVLVGNVWVERQQGFYGRAKLTGNNAERIARLHNV